MLGGIVIGKLIRARTDGEPDSGRLAGASVVTEKWRQLDIDGKR